MPREIVIVSITKVGQQIGRKVKSYLTQTNTHCVHYTIERIASGEVEPIVGSLLEWTKEQWDVVDSIIFVGATGIAVRMIAPFVSDKKKDRAVLVIDELGQFVISLLSGHTGGANHLASELANEIGGIAVITTATDIQDKFAVDVFAKKNNLVFTNSILAKQISVALLEGGKVGMYSHKQIKGKIPKEVHICRTEEELSLYTTGVCISHIKREVPQNTLLLLEQDIVVGIGCKKDTKALDIHAFLIKMLEKHGLVESQIYTIASIDLKKEEPGIIEVAKSLRVPFITYTKEALEAVSFSGEESDFVTEVTGIGNVCERAAILGSNEGIIIQEKCKEKGITLALARKEQVLEFER